MIAKHARDVKKKIKGDKKSKNKQKKRTQAAFCQYILIYLPPCRCACKPGQKKREYALRKSNHYNQHLKIAPQIPLIQSTPTTGEHFIKEPPQRPKR